MFDRTSMNRSLSLTVYSPFESSEIGLAQRRARIILIMLANSRIDDPGIDLHLSGARVEELVLNSSIDPRILFNQSYLQSLASSQNRSVH